MIRFYWIFDLKMWYKAIIYLYSLLYDLSLEPYNQGVSKMRRIFIECVLIWGLVICSSVTAATPNKVGLSQTDENPLPLTLSFFSVDPSPAIVGQNFRFIFLWSIEPDQVYIE